MTRDEQNFMDWCQRNGIPWPGTCSPMCLAWVAAVRQERMEIAAAGVSIAEQYEANAQLHPNEAAFVASMKDRAVGTLNMVATVTNRGQA